MASPVQSPQEEDGRQPKDRAASVTESAAQKQENSSSRKTDAASDSRDPTNESNADLGSAISKAEDEPEDDRDSDDDIPEFEFGAPRGRITSQVAGSKPPKPR